MANFPRGFQLTSGDAVASPSSGVPSSPGSPQTVNLHAVSHSEANQETRALLLQLAMMKDELRSVHRELRAFIDRNDANMDLVIRVLGPQLHTVRHYKPAHDHLRFPRPGTH